jgi:uncharacterized protein (TIGR02594 family)
MLTRRHTLVGMSSLAVTLHAGGALSQEVEDTVLPPLPLELQAFGQEPDVRGPVTDYKPYGTYEPTSKQKVLAQKVLAGAQGKAPPVEVARYFLSVAQGGQGADLRSYAMAWPHYWNPVIVEFFRKIRSTSQGDTTAWCAAFMNYCLMSAATSRPLPAGSAPPTRSAASRSFRIWGQKTDAPTPGDIVVFADKGDDAHGHVGFFLAQDDTRVLVLGGNQFDGTPVRHVVCRKWLAKDGGKLKLHSYRTDPQLHA